MSILSKEIIKEWDLSGLTEEEQSEVILRIGETLYQAILVRSMDVLGEEDQDELDSLLDNDATTPEDAIRFLRGKMPNFEKVLAEEKKSLEKDISLFVS